MKFNYVICFATPTYFKGVLIDIENSGIFNCCRTLREVDKWFDIMITKRLGEDLENVEVEEIRNDPDDPQKKFILYSGTDVKKIKRVVKNNFYKTLPFNLRIKISHHHTFPKYFGGVNPSTIDYYNIYRATDFSCVEG